jgi:hypothetical protein
VHVDIIGPLATSDGFKYCLTAVDRYSRWHEAFPMVDITADTVARTTLAGWISRHGCPHTITTDEGRQFESNLWPKLASLCGIHLTRTTAFHPAAKGMVERMLRTLNAAIMCRQQERWTDALPLVLLGMRTAFKADLQASAAELVYGEPLPIPGELLLAPIKPFDTADMMDNYGSTFRRFGQLQLLGIHLRMSSNTRILPNQPTSSCVKTLLDARWNLPTLARTRL